jgi:hypothetical protein
MNLREKILNMSDVKKELVEIEEWECKVEVRSLSGKERAKISSSAVDGNGKVDMENMYPTILIASCFDPETGEKLFTEGDRDILNTKNASALEKIAVVAMRLSGLSQSAEKQAIKN